MSELWFDEGGNRRGVLDETSFQEALGNAVSILLFLASDGPATVSQVVAGVTGLTTRRATILLDRLVDAGGATVDDGTYTGVLVEDEA